jgi:CheY-like chemotaxis protein
MSTADHLCIFERASGERLLAAERFVLALPQLLGAALDGCDLGLDASSYRLLVLLRLAPAAAPAGARERLAFWAARAGGRASDIGQIPEGDLAELRAAIDRCEPSLADVAGAELYLATAAFFTDAGAPALRRRKPGERPALALDLAGAAAAGASYDPSAAALFVPSPMAPPEGDELPSSSACPAPRVVEGRTRVVGVRRPAEASPARRRLRARGGAGAARATSRPRRARRAAHAPVVRRHAELPAHRAPRAREGAGPDRAPPRPDGAGRLRDDRLPERRRARAGLRREPLSGRRVRPNNRPRRSAPRRARDQAPRRRRPPPRATVAFVNDAGMGVRVQLEPAEAARLYAAIVQLTARPRRALVVDDDALHRRMLGDALEARGFEVVTAADGAEGLRALADELLTLDLCLTDACMPGMDGEAFVRTIREAGGETELAVVVVTGRSDPELSPRLLAAGADGVLEKTLGADKVAEAADGVMEGKRIRARTSA